MPLRTYLILLLLLPLHAIAQFRPDVAMYHKHMNEGKIWYVKKDNKKAVENCKKAFTYHKPVREDLDLAAYWCSLAGNDKDAIRYYKQAVLNGLAYDDTAAYPDHYRRCLGTKEYRSFIRTLDSLHQQFERGLNVELCMLVTRLMTADQLIRGDQFLMNTDTVIRNFSSKTLVTIDTNSINALTEYILKHGLPQENEMTPDVALNFRLLIHHACYYGNYEHSKEKAERLLYLIRKGIYEGQLPNTFLYTGLDRAHVLCCKTQLYGTFTSRSNGKITYSNIEDIAHVDERRQNWLLLPLYWSMRFNFENNYQLPEGYTFKDEQ